MNRLLVLGSLFALAACGGGGSDAPATAAPPPAPAPAPVPAPEPVSADIDRTKSDWGVFTIPNQVTGRTMTVLRANAITAAFAISCDSDGSKSMYISTSFVTGSGRVNYRIGNSPAVLVDWPEGSSFQGLYPAFDSSLMLKLYKNWDLTAELHRFGVGFITVAFPAQGFSAAIDKSRAACGWSTTTFPPKNHWPDAYPDTPPSNAKEATYVAGAAQQFGLVAWKAANSLGETRLLARLATDKARCSGDPVIDDTHLYVVQNGKRVSAVSGTAFTLNCKTTSPLTLALDGDFDPTRPLTLTAYPRGGVGIYGTTALNPGEPISSVDLP